MGNYGAAKTKPKIKNRLEFFLNLTNSNADAWSIPPLASESPTGLVESGRLAESDGAADGSPDEPPDLESSPQEGVNLSFHHILDRKPMLINIHY